MLDMNQLFEDFVTARLQRALCGRLDVRAQTRPYLDDERQVQIKPDLTFRHRGETVGVADLKYKLAEADTSTTGPAGPLARHGDYYQLLAYTTALNLSEGTLIYCADVDRDGSDELDDSAESERVGSAADEAASCDDAVATLAKSTVTVRHAGTRLHAVAIDLSGSPSDIDAQIFALAGHLEGSARRQNAA